LWQELAELKANHQHRVAELEELARSQRLGSEGELRAEMQAALARQRQAMEEEAEQQRKRLEQKVIVMEERHRWAAQVPRLFSLNPFN
jgi:hypothetical protein